MTITRRGLLAGIFAAAAAPAIVTRSGILMPVRSIIVPDIAKLFAVEIEGYDRQWLTEMEAQRMARLAKLHVGQIDRFRFIVTSIK